MANKMFKNPFEFTGRIRRTEYGISYIIYVLIYFLGINLIGNFDSQYSTIFFILLWIPMFWFLLAQGAKRCHDRGNSGWFQLIPFYGLVMLFGDSDHGKNKYGPNPKGIGNDSEINDIGKPIE